MAGVRTVSLPEIGLPSLKGGESDEQGFLSLTMAALRLARPWAREAVAVPRLAARPASRIITLEEVACHDTSEDCWLIIYDRVYDFTHFLHEHPGGGDILLEYAGRDASLAFRGAGHGRSTGAALDRHLLGELPLHERIFRKPGGIPLGDIPD